MRGILLTACCILPTIVFGAPQEAAPAPATKQSVALSIKATIPVARVTAGLTLAELPGDSTLPMLVAARLHLPEALRNYLVHLDQIRVNGTPLTPVKPSAEVLAVRLFSQPLSAAGDIDFFVDAAALRAIVGDNSVVRQVTLQTTIGAGHLLEASSGLLGAATP